MASSNSSSYRPQESAQDILSEHTWLQGAFLAAVAFGMSSILYFMTIHLLRVHPLSRKSKNVDGWGKRMGLIVYITVIFILGILYMAGLLQFTQQSFIDDRNYPGGPNVYEEVMFSIPVDMLANVIMVLLTWMCDIINVWRCSVIYTGSRIPVYVVIAIPVLLYLASVSTGILFLKQVGTPSASPWDSTGINWTIPYYTMSLSLNIIVTILIVARLLVYRARISRVMGKGHGAEYASLAAMIVESAAIYSTFSIMFLIPFATGSPIAQLFLQALSPVQVFSTFLIIFRVAQGKGWSHDQITAALTSTIGGSSNKTGMKFRTRNTTTTFSELHTTGHHGTAEISLEHVRVAESHDTGSETEKDASSSKVFSSL